MKVRVLKRRADVSYWYGNKIGQTFEVVCENHEVEKLEALKPKDGSESPVWMSGLEASYVVRTKEDDYYNFGIILKEDCETVNTQPIFQQGDSLRCIDNGAVEMYLNKGAIYECDHINDKYVWVKCNHRYLPSVGFSPSRFEKVIFEGRTKDIVTHYPIAEDFKHITPEQDVLLKQRVAEQVKDALAESPVEEKEAEYTGASVSYYKVFVKNPTDMAEEPYMAECNDIIRALKMSYCEGNAFKAIWRSCAARNLGLAKKGYDNGLYDAQKVVFFGTDMIKDAEEKQ